MQIGGPFGRGPYVYPTGHTEVGGSIPWSRGSMLVESASGWR